jgi:apolipoprotein N-acyltransferase
VLPLPVLIVSLTVPSFFFALAVMGGRVSAKRLAPVAGMLAFACLGAAFDFLASFSKGGGSVTTPATAEVFVPMLIQSASIVGVWGITFLLGFVPAGLALSLRQRTVLPAALAVAVFAANAVLGYLRMSAPAQTIPVTLIDTDSMDQAAMRDDPKLTADTVAAYAKAIRAVKGASLIVLPEKLAIVDAAQQPALQARFAEAAHTANATLVAGLDARDGAKAYNVSWAFTPASNAPAVYTKRRLVPGLEQRYTIGAGPLALANGTGLEICKDMDFQAMIRHDMVATKPRLLAVPAWDFVADATDHARVAILRSVENGVPMARTARNGLMTLNDRYGRIVAMKVTGGEGFKTLSGNLPLDGRGGDTIYDRIGDVFGWLCLILGLGLTGAALLRRRHSM